MSRKLSDAKTRYKVVLLGAVAVGKTMICKQLLGQYFHHNTMHSMLTIGVDFCLHEIKFNDETLIKLQIVDTRGDDQTFEQIVKPYYQDAQGIIMCYDITDEASFQTAKNRINMIKQSEVNQNYHSYLFIPLQYLLPLHFYLVWDFYFFIGW